MGRFGVCRFVTRHRRIADDAVEEILAGRVPEGHEELAHLAHFTSDLRSFPAASSDGIVAMMAAAGHANDKGDLPATAASNAHGPTRSWQGAGLPNWNRRPAMLKTFLSNAIAKAAVGVTAATVAVGSAGAAGALPGPVQRVVADAADVVGLNLPTPDDDAVTDPATDSRTKVDDNDSAREHHGGAPVNPAPLIDPGSVTLDPTPAVVPSDDPSHDSADDPSHDSADDDTSDNSSDDNEADGHQADQADGQS